MPTLTQKVEIQNLKGLHARATSAFVKVASSFESDMQITNEEGMTVSGKSIMDILMLAVPLGAEITLTITGNDADKAMKELVNLINNRFGEE